MATIMASRAKHHAEISDPVELYTYGSPRVGWKGYVNDFHVKHYRWKNNNDIVTTVPLILMGYKHCGDEHYLNAYGEFRTPTGWQRTKDKFRGFWMGLKQGKIDNFSDHSIDEYIKHITRL
jgi:triacylglycerol lipase